MKNDQYERSRTVTLPFINLDPSNLSTIYTAQCEKHGLQVCPVTFDQPLYIKAAEIVASAQDLDKVVVRLGGFHLLMSYLGSNTAATSWAINDEDILPTTAEISVEDTAPDDEEKMKPNAAETIIGRA